MTGTSSHTHVLRKTDVSLAHVNDNPDEKIGSKQTR